MDFEEPRAMDDRPRLLLHFSLTLVKGDEVVQVAEEGTDGALLGNTGNRHPHLLQHANSEPRLRGLT